MRPEREFTIPEVGLLQWWSDAPWPDVHWYAGEDRNAYRVTLDEDGQPVKVTSEDGRLTFQLPAAQYDDTGLLFV